MWVSTSVPSWLPLCVLGFGGPPSGDRPPESMLSFNVAVLALGRERCHKTMLLRTGVGDGSLSFFPVCCLTLLTMPLTFL